MLVVEKRNGLVNIYLDTNTKEHEYFATQSCHNILSSLHSKRAFTFTDMWDSFSTFSASE